MVDLMNRWAVNMALGGNPVFFPGLSSFPAVASADGKYSIVVLAHLLRVYFLQTRQCIRSVEVDLRDSISVFLDPQNSHQVIVFSNSGVRHVNWMDKVQSPVVATQTFEPPIKGLREICHMTSTSYFALAETESECLVHQIDKELAKTTPVLELPAARMAAVSSNGHQLAVWSDKLRLYNISAAFEDSAKNYAVILNTKEEFALNGKPTSMAVSNSGVVAVGLSMGAIVMFHGGISGGLPKKTLRWHIDPVLSLTFSADEVYLVSGGNEKVLVFWHLDLDKMQFLPRLSGPIDRIFVDKNRPDHYSVALRVYEGPQKSRFHEILTLLAVDLVSRLSVSPVCPNFSNCLDSVLKKGHKKQILNADFSAKVAVHPTSKHLYFARGALIQAYDVIKGEQAFVQHAAPQVSTGKVKSEHQIADPVLSQVAFTPDGAWMATFDAMPTLGFDNLMLKNDVAYALKFWKLADAGWTLALKIVDPHGAGREVGCILSTGENFTTIDTNGGIRLWRPRPNNSLGKTQSVWTLRRASPPLAAKGAVAACFSADKSLLVVSHGCYMQAYQPELLHRISFTLPAMDLPVESLTIAGLYLVVASKRQVMLYDLVAARETALCVHNPAPGAGNLCAVDTKNQIVAMAVMKYKEQTKEARGRILLFKPDSLEPIFSASHPTPIASIASTPAGFIFIDTDSRIGYVAPEVNNHLAEKMDDLSLQMNKLLDNAQAAANVLFARVEENIQEKLEENSAKWATHKMLDATQLQPIFTHTEGVSLESLFDRITRLVQ